MSQEVTDVLDDQRLDEDEVSDLLWRAHYKARNPEKYLMKADKEMINEATQAKGDEKEAVTAPEAGEQGDWTLEADRETNWSPGP